MAKKLELTNKLKEQEEALKIAKIEHAQSLQDGSSFSEKVEISAESTVTDSDNTFYAQTNHTGTYSDTLEIKTKNGLLDGALGHSEDKTGEITATLAGVLATAFKGPGLQPFKRRFLKRQPEDVYNCEKKLVSNITQVVDPFSPHDMQALNKRLQDSGCLRIDLMTPTPPQNAAILGKQDANGLIYRQPGIVKFEIYDTTTVSAGVHIQTISLALAQGGHIGILPMPKGKFSKNEYDVAFSNGALTKSRIVQPSEVLGAAMIVPNTIKGIFALPTELIQLKVDYSSSEKSLLELKKAMIEAQVEIEKKQIELDAIKTTGTAE
ncbi:hypothetical protein D6Z43_08610 [Pseudomonas sp. DY-1]|nr:hypothetical protein D6Z43_08610 [Pseudomonas sp. DY-1]